MEFSWRTLCSNNFCRLGNGWSLECNILLVCTQSQTDSLKTSYITKEPRNVLTAMHDQQWSINLPSGSRHVFNSISYKRLMNKIFSNYLCPYLGHFPSHLITEGLWWHASEKQALYYIESRSSVIYFTILKNILRLDHYVDVGPDRHFFVDILLKKLIRFYHSMRLLRLFRVPSAAACFFPFGFLDEKLA